ncbi:hypothetical protein B0H19DRAFT_1275303 [Mycena capillaripes]|nr:hypothetical protein B0H19DRAFT_1275303 [Mycena capillaripes]
MASQISFFYRIWFTIVDPVLSFCGAMDVILVPGTVLNGYTPKTVSLPAPETIMLLDTPSGFFFCPHLHPSYALACEARRRRDVAHPELQHPPSVILGGLNTRREASRAYILLRAERKNR